MKQLIRRKHRSGWEGLDFSSHSGDGKKIAGFTTKKAAAKFAKECGWTAGDVQKAFTHLQLFYVVGQYTQNNIRILCDDKSWIDFPYIFQSEYSLPRGVA